MPEPPRGFQGLCAGDVKLRSGARRKSGKTSISTSGAQSLSS